MSTTIDVSKNSFDLQTKISVFSLKKILESYISLASILSGQILSTLEWQEFLISYLRSSILTLFARNIPKQLQLPELIDEKNLTSRLNVREVDLKDVKIVEQAGKTGGKKKKGKKGERKKNEKKVTDQNKNNEEDNTLKSREREKRQREWEETWNKKLEAQEALEDEAFCAAHGFYPKPKTQTNIWVQVYFGKLSNEVQFCFRKDPITKPPAPPFLKIEESGPAVEKDEEEKGKQMRKKKRKRKGKK